MPESRAGLCSLCAGCLLPARQNWGITWTQPQESHAQIFWGSHAGVPRVSRSLWGAQRGVALGKGELWWGLHRQSSPHACSSEGLRWLLPTKPQPPASKCLSCKCSAHTTSISVIYLINFFYIIGIIFCSKHLPTTRPTVQNWRSDWILQGQTSSTAQSEKLI